MAAMDIRLNMGIYGKKNNRRIQVSYSNRPSISSPEIDEFKSGLAGIGQLAPLVCVRGTQVFVYSLIKIIRASLRLTHQLQVFHFQNSSKQ
jgi:hypothetical protein